MSDQPTVINHDKFICCACGNLSYVHEVDGGGQDDNGGWSRFSLSCETDCCNAGYRLQGQESQADRQARAEAQASAMANRSFDQLFNSVFRN